MLTKSSFSLYRTIATPPASPPLPPPLPSPCPPPTVASMSPSTQKWTRKATRLQSLATRPLGEERPMVNVDPATDKANAPYKKKLRRYSGLSLVIRSTPYMRPGRNSLLLRRI